MLTNEEDFIVSSKNVKIWSYFPTVYFGEIFQWTYINLHVAEFNQSIV